MCGTMNALLYRRLRYALNLYPSVLSGYLNLLPLAIHCLALHPLPTLLFLLNPQPLAYKKILCLSNSSPS